MRTIALLTMVLVMSAALSACMTLDAAMTNWKSILYGSRTDRCWDSGSKLNWVYTSADNRGRSETCSSLLHVFNCCARAVDHDDLC